MTRLMIVILLCFSLILQLTLMPRLTVFGVFPNILLAAILVLATKFSGNWVLIAAFLSGLALDFFSSLPFVAWVASLTVAIWLMEVAGKKFLKTSDFSGQACLIAGACLFFSFFQLFMIKVFFWFGLGASLPFWQNILRVSLLESVMSSVLALIFLILSNRYGLRARG